MFRTMRKVCKWVLVILLVLTVATAGVGYYYYSKSDELLQRALLSALKKWAPDADVQLGRCRLDWYGRVHVETLSLGLPGEDGTFVELPETIVDLDREAFLERQDVVVSTVKLVQPRVELFRDLDGVWNWQKLPPLPVSQGRRTSLPTCELEDAQLVLRIAQPDLPEPSVLELDNVDLKLTPSGKRNLLIEGTTNIERVGRLMIEGRLDVDSRTGSLTGRLSGLSVDRSLLSLISGFEPRAAQQIASIEQIMRDQMLRQPDPKSKSPFSIEGIGLKETGVVDMFQPAASVSASPQDRLAAGRIRGGSAIRSTAGSSAMPVIINASAGSATLPKPHGIPALVIGEEDSVLGLRADLDVSFRLNIPTAGARPEVRVVVDVTGGEITNTALPFPLEALSGQIDCTEQEVTIRKLSGINGPTKLEVNGAVFRTDAGQSGRIDVQLTNLACDERLRNRLSTGFGRIYDIHHPSGFLDMKVSLTGTDGQWKPGGLVVTAKQCSVSHDFFPYPVHNAVGSISQNGKDLEIDILGYVGTRPISLKGVVRNPGPEARLKFDIEVEDLPLDETFYAACNDSLKATLNSMNLGGLVDGHVTIERQPGEGQKMRPTLTGWLKNGTMAFESFPYRVNELSGRLDFDGQDWSFTKLQGVHGDAKLGAEGSYVTSTGLPGELNLTVTTENAAIDESLRLAMPPNLQEMWAEFSPSGTIERCVTKAYWRKGQPARITLPELIVTNSRIQMAAFPWEMTDGDASFRYDIDDESGVAWLSVNSYTGRHGNTQLTAQGSVQIEPNGDWWVRLPQWSAIDFAADDSFLTAVSPDLASVFSAFDPQKKMNVSGMLQFRGKPDPRIPMTAAWDVAATLKGNRLAVGVDLDDVHGRLTSSGQWNGFEVVDGKGQIDLKTLTLLDGYRLHNIRGPFRVGNGEVWAGSRDILEGKTGRPIRPDEQITADFVGGVLSINTKSSTGAQPKYSARINLSHGRLEQYAKLYMNSSDRLQGVMNGWVNLEGAGTNPDNLTGKGQLQIDPAALYQMPVILQVMNALTIAPQDNAFFEYARVDFQIRKQRFEFSAIDLVGTPMQLRGQGTASFDGNLALKFVSMLPNNPRAMARRPGIWIPILTDAIGLIGGVGNLVGVVVEVSGKTSNPTTRVIPARNLDDALRGFVNSLKPIPLTPPAPPRLPPVAGSKPSTRPR